MPMLTPISKQAQQEQPSRPQRGKPVGQQHVEGGAQHRGKQVAGAADHGDDQDHFARVVFGVRQRRDAGHHRVQSTRQAGDGARDHEGQQLEALEVVAHRGGAVLVVANGEQRAAEHRVGHAQQQAEGNEEHHRHKGVVLPGRVHEGGARHVEQAVVATREPRSGVRHKVEHLREGQREHHEVGAALAYGHPADHRCTERPHGDGGQQRERHRQLQPREQNCDGVAAQPKEDALPEREQARVAQQQIAAQRGKRINEHLARERARAQHQRKAERNDERQEESYFSWHGDVHPLRPSKPCGRKSSTAPIAT